MRSMRPFINKFGSGLQLKPISITWASPRLQTPSQPTSPPGHHLPEEVSSAGGTRGEVAVEVEGHEALQASDTGATDEDGGDDEGMEVADLSSSGRAAPMADPPYIAVGELGSEAAALIRAEQRTEGAREAVGHVQSGRYLPRGIQSSVQEAELPTRPGESWVVQIVGAPAGARSGAASRLAQGHQHCEWVQRGQTELE